MLIIAATLTFMIGLVHSVLGERYILTRLFRIEKLPALFGDDWFTRQTLRFAWHITTLAWWGLGTIMLLIASDPANLEKSILLSLSTVFLCSALIAAIFSKFKHLSWLVFVTIALLCSFAAIFTNY